MNHYSSDLDTVELSKKFFLGVGAARSGTTWLTAVLRQHPEIFLTEVKELHYFNWALLKDESASMAVRAALAVKRKMMPPRFQEYLLNRFYENNLARRVLLREQPNHQWYFRLFQNAAPTSIAGEFTPGYAVLPDHIVAEMAALIPHSRLVFIMREPVERVWSHYRYQIGKGVMTAEDIKSNPTQFFAGRTDYTTTIEKFERHFPVEQIFYGYYEDFIADPKRYFNKLCEFLGVSPVNEAMLKTSEMRINPSKENNDCPPELRIALKSQYSHLIRELQEKIGRVPPSWLE